MRGIHHHEDWGWSNAPRFGGSQPSGNTTTTQTSTPWNGQQPYLTDIYGQAQSLDQAPSPQYFPGSTYQPLTAQQQGLMSNLIGYTGMGGGSSLQAANSNITSALSPGATAQTGQTFGAANDALSRELDPSYLNPANSPTYNTAIRNALAVAVPAASASFVNGNRTGGGLAQAATTAAAANAAGGLAQQQYDINQQIQNAAVGTASNNLLTQQGNQTRDLLTAPMIDQAISGNLGTALSTAGMTQTDLQNQIAANIARWNYGQMLPWNQLGLYEGAVTGAGNPGGTTTTQQPYFQNPLANVTSAASGIGSLGLLAYLALSDRDLKTDIHKIGESDSGFPLYTFRYKWEGPMSMHIGVMAQDVEKKRPQAVVHTPVGRMVDYMEALAA